MRDPRAMTSRPARPAVLTAMLAAILAAMLVPATAQRCKATFRPVTVDMSSDEGGGYGNGDSGMSRLSVNYVELETTDGSPIYVKPRGCPAGTREPDRVVQFMQPGCDTMRIESDTNPSVTYPACLGDEDAFWADPFTHACVDNGWDIWCDIHDPTEWGGGEEFTYMCCPDDKPNYIFLTDYESWNPGAGYCTAAKFPAELSGQGVGEELLSGDYDFSDKIRGSGQVDLELMTIKDLYDTYDAKAATMMESMVGIHAADCEGETRQAVSMPPFAKDVVSTYFAFIHDNPIPGNDEIRSIRKLTPFDSAMSKKNTDGTCRMVVSLKDVPEVEGELVSIDGVDFSCLMSAYSRVPDAYVVLDAYTALARTTGKVPAADENVTVTLKASDGTLTDYSVSSKYEYYNSLKTKLDKRNEDRWMRDFECGGMDFNRRAGRLNPANLNPTCPRDGVTAEVNDPRAEAMANMSTSKLGFAIFGKMFNIATGRDVDMSNPNPPNFDPEKGRVCGVGLHPGHDMATFEPLETGGLFNADGDPICMNDIIFPTRAPGHCSFERFGELTIQMNKLIDAAVAGTSTAKWSDFMQYTGKDDWIECMDIFMSSMTDAVGEKQIETDMCSKELPEDVYDPWGFCRNATDNAYCTDPCCNFDLQNKMCCAPTMQTVSVPRPEIDWENFAYRCLASDYSVRGSCGVECFDENNTIGSALAPATNIFKTQKAPDICLEVSSAVTTKALAIESDLSCCLKAVIGEFDWNSNSFKSNQPCNNPSDCYSGKCIKTKEDSNPEKDLGDSDRCFLEGKSFTNACAVASQEKAGEALATCVIDKLTSRGGFERQIASLKVMLGGSVSATLAEMGDGIISLGAHETCEGPDGWRYDPNNWCQNFNMTSGKCGDNNCDTVEECKTACLAATVCNWRSWTHDSVTYEWRQTTSAECTDSSLTAGFCEAKNEWGGVDDLTEQGFCRPSTPMIHGDYGWMHEHANITTTMCADVDTGLAATNLPWGWGEKHCTWSAGNSDKDACFAECSGTSGFKPPKLYQCYKDTNAATGKCEATGWFTDRREDWDVDLPWDVKRPTFCVTDTWGPNGVDANPGSNWTLDLSAVASLSGVTGLQGNPLQKSWVTNTDADWVPNVLGHGSHWDGLTFTNETIANAVCGALGASTRVSDDGTDSCGEDTCWLDVDKSTCDSLSPSGITGHGWFEWRGSYDGGDGVCIARPNGADAYNPWSSGGQATKNRKTLCADIHTWAQGNGGHTATFYIGRTYHASKFDTQTKCEGSGGNVQYCSVTGARYDVDNSTCEGIGGSCQNTDGCMGCRAPWYGEVVDSNGDVVDKQGICYKGGASNSSDCATGHTHVASLDICVDEAATDFDQCSDMSWSTCEDIAPEVCEDHSTQNTIPHYISNFLSCRRDKKTSFCDSEAECEASGRCMGPMLRDQICYFDEDLDTHTCKIFSNACKVDVDPDRLHMCSGSPDCDNEWGHCWDDMRDHFGDYCVDYTIQTESACDAASGEWLTINATTQREFCTSDVECQGGRSEWGGVWERDETECRACGGTMRSWGQWSSGTWVTPEMVSGGRAWKTRAMEQANVWSARIDEWRVRDLVRTIETQLNNEAQAAFALCMYGEIGDSVEKLASVCGGASSTQRGVALVQDYPQFCNVSQYNGTAAKTGRKGSTNVEIDTDSLDGVGQMCAVSTPAQPNNGTSPTSVRRRSLSRRLLSEANEPSFDDASCWSLVRNSNDALVGQLLGDCVLVSLTGGLSTRNGVRVCLQTKPEREIDDAYTVDGFVERTEVDGAFKYTPVQKTVTREGEQLCANVTEMDTYFCPARLVDSWASATADVGSDECEIMVLMAEMQARAQKRLLAQGDEIEDATIAGIAVACFVFVVGVAVGAYVCVRRRKRFREKADANRQTVKKSAVAVDTQQLTL